MATEICNIYKICANDLHKILQFGVLNFGCSLQFFTSQIASPQIFAAPAETNLCHKL